MVYSRNLLSVCFALFLILFSCGKEEEKSKGDKNKINGVKGQWDGFIVESEDNTLDDEQQPIKLIFDKNGSFQLTIENSSKAFASGTYTIFSSSILFKIEYSNISVFGLPNTIVDINYSQYGTGILLKSERFQIKALFNDGKKSSNRSTTSSLSSLNGSWLGLDNNQNMWDLTIKKDGSFFASINNKQSKNLKISGVIIPNGKVIQSHFLLIEKSNNNSTIGQKIQFILLDTKTIKVLIKGSTSSREFTLAKG
jgi:hypothetical protein